MNLFKSKKKGDPKLAQKVFDYFKVEHTEKETFALGDFADKEFCHWLRFIQGLIQKALKEKLIDGEKVKDYVSLTCYLGGQRVDIAIIKDGHKGPHELLEDLRKADAK